MNPMATDPQRRRLLQGVAAGLLAWPLHSLAGETPLQLLSAIEAFSGMFLTGLFLAGFASKTKQY